MLSLQPRLQSNSRASFVPIEPLPASRKQDVLTRFTLFNQKENWHLQYLFLGREFCMCKSPYIAGGTYCWETQARKETAAKLGDIYFKLWMKKSSKIQLKPGQPSDFFFNIKHLCQVLRCCFCCLNRTLTTSAGTFIGRLRRKLKITLQGSHICSRQEKASFTRRINLL